jgi:hypothetical protein
MELLNSLFLPMLAGHLIADFWLQPSAWVADKRRLGWKSKKLYFHSFASAILPVLFTLRPELWWFSPIIFATHVVIDFLKSKAKDNILFFFADQILHIAVLASLAFWAGKIILPETLQKFWIYACGFILVTTPLGILTGMFLKSVIKAGSVSAKLDASAWIGILERILILIFILAGQFSAIGFLIAAKSIFRFNETKEGNNPKAEYFLLGTLVSFVLALLVGIAIQHLVKMNFAC